MEFSLTKPQRIVALATAGAIAIVLWVQVEENGLEDTPWLIGFLIIAALISLALKSSSTSADSLAQKKKHQVAVAKELKQLSVEQFFSSARNHFERFYREQIEALKDTKRANVLKTKQASLIREAAFMATMLDLEVKMNGFSETHGAEKLRKITFRGISDVIQLQEDIFRKQATTLASEKATLVFKRPSKDIGDELAALIVGNAEVAISESKVRFIGDKTYPMEPIFKRLDRAILLAGDSLEDRDRVYGPVFKSYFEAVRGRLVLDCDAEVALQDRTDNDTEQLPATLQTAVDGLLDQMMIAAKNGEKPETMLIPHIRLKLDIIVAVYEKDMKLAISELYDQKFEREEATGRAGIIRADIDKMIYNLRREPSSRIQELFQAMFSDRTDIADIEKQVRASNKLYDTVPPIC